MSSRVETLAQAASGVFPLLSVVVLLLSFLACELLQASPDPSAKSQPAVAYTPSAAQVTKAGLHPSERSLLPEIAALTQHTPVYDRPIIVDGRPGDREEIGLFTEWQSELLATGRNRDLIIQQADSMLDAPWCDYDAMKMPPWKGGKYAVSFSHLPNLYFLPYLAWFYDRDGYRAPLVILPAAAVVALLPFLSPERISLPALPSSRRGVRGVMSMCSGGLKVAFAAAAPGG